MKFGLLGPMLVHDGDQDIAIPAARQRVLLAAMLVRAGRVVAAGELAEMVWDGMPPPGAATTLRSYVKRLRQVLGPRAGARVITRYPGYLLSAGKNEVDLLRFTSLCREGGDAVRDGSWARASAQLGEALGLWRGAAMADVPSSTLQRDESSRLEQLRLQATEWRIEAGLHLGWDGELLPELQTLAVEFPLRERFHAQLMLALYRCGRQGEALAAYRHARQTLVRELGTEPGIELRELHQRILAADSGLLDGPHQARLAISPPPRQLPAAPGPFTGRGQELDALTARLLPGGHRPKTVVLLLLGGPAGVGKTALALHWAHEVSHRFPDGQLFVDLRGYDCQEPVDPAQALAGLLSALEVPAHEIPADLDARAARYRSLMAGRRMLVLLDNASSAEQVRPLLPGTAGNLAVITSRNALTGLVVREGAQRIDLGVLTSGESAELLCALIGSRAAADWPGRRMLAERCSRLPLALRLAAELACLQPGAGLADLAGELAEQGRRLQLLDLGGDDPRSAIRTVFSWSYQRLPEDQATAFRLLGLYPGVDFDL
ncbi:MAG TPA: BTAD domain-containing putative transcriptional regulator, partial [Streptosporangiaceae bacterium]|nr:BTAD domain-containing putative transcriptional regulator [Streptosporangiaceae bacterium]